MADDDELARILRVFKAYDLDGDGVIDASELGKVLKGLDPDTWTDARIRDFMSVADMNGDGMLQYDEFVSWVMGKTDLSAEAVAYGEDFAENCPSNMKPCKFGAKCYNRNPRHTSKFWHPQEIEDNVLRPEARRACKFGAACYRRNSAHLEGFAHPGDRNYRLGLVMFSRGRQPEFHTLWQLFNYYDPDESGHISKDEFETTLGDVRRYGGTVDNVDAAWTKAGGDDHGYINFAHYSQWASSTGVELPIGLDTVGADKPCRFRMMVKGGWSCACANFEPGNNPDICACGHKKSLHRADEVGDPWDYVRAENLPWVEGRNGLVEVEDLDLHAKMQELLDATHKEKDNWTRDRGCKIHGRSHPECSMRCIRRNGWRVPKGYRLTKIFRNQNADLWRAFCMSRASISVECEAEEPVEYEDVSVVAHADLDNDLKPNCNEWRLFHGTSLGACRGISDSNFRLSLSGTGATWKDPGADKGSPLYGYGIYLAERITKADEYAGDCEGEDAGLNCALICRCVGGRANVVETNEIDKQQLRQDVFDGPYHCVYGDRVKTLGKPYREIVVYDKDQIFPEFMIYYERLME